MEELRGSRRRSTRVKKTTTIFAAGPLRKSRGTGNRIVKQKKKYRKRKKQETAQDASIRAIARERIKKISAKLESKLQTVIPNLIE